MVVVERTGVADAASGKSGGFLARDWCDGSPLASLARRGFDLHVFLANSLDQDWGYRQVETLRIIASVPSDVGPYRNLPSLAWLGEDAAVYSQLGSPETTAQISPAAFTNAMMDAAIDGGAKLIAGCVDGVVLSPDGDRVTGVMIDGAMLSGDAVVIAMGPFGRCLPANGCSCRQQAARRAIAWCSTTHRRQNRCLLSLKTAIER